MFISNIEKRAEGQIIMGKEQDRGRQYSDGQPKQRKGNSVFTGLCEFPEDHKADNYTGNGQGIFNEHAETEQCAG